MVYVLAWLRALAFTQIVEAPLYRRMLGLRWDASLAPSLLTHPFVWFVFPLLGRVGVPFAWWVAIAETSVWLAEAALLARIANVPWSRGAHASFVANTTSFGLGLLANRLGGI
jgi:hypothetical protein